MKGLILLNKPKDMTSFGAVARVRRIMGEKKAGHTGTLDPMATGVLPVLLGSATKLSDYLLAADKSYTATMRLGVTTDTLDITGTVLSTRKVDATKQDVLNALNSFCGEILQTPPMYSAIKQNGQPLYKLARKGIEAERTARKVTIYEIELLEQLSSTDFTVSVRCSKGTYIRSLVADIGEALGCGATLTELCRTSTGGFSIENCVTIEQLEQDGSAYLLPAVKAVEHLPYVEVTDKQATRFSNGGELDLSRLKGDFGSTDKPIRVMYDRELIGIGEIDNEVQALKIKCVIK